MFDPSFLLHPLGYCPGTPHQQMLCRGLNAWSGIGSDLGEMTLIGVALGWAKHHNCHQKGCWRLGHRHPGHGRPVCRRHFHTEPQLGDTEAP